ncbi:hypothetical protein [Streptomyces noursei]|uniref:hypothetical protein n=1 Tax=Streptomyces noursei TaxID=1971 RepID=UPI0023B7798D|nr:hypothetical protein [Streptomyces noursei]
MNDYDSFSEAHHEFDNRSLISNRITNAGLHLEDLFLSRAVPCRAVPCRAAIYAPSGG